LYSAAAELWVNDASFAISDPQLTQTPSAQVPNIGRPNKGLGMRGRGRGRGGGRVGRPPKVWRGPGGEGTSKRERPGALAQPTSVHGILVEMLADSPAVSFQLVPPRQPRSRALPRPPLPGTDMDHFCIVSATHVSESATHAIEVRAGSTVLAWLHDDGVLRPADAGDQLELKPAASAPPGEGAAPMEVESASELGADDAPPAEAHNPPPKKLAASAGWVDDASCLASNKPQRKRKAVNYVEFDDGGRKPFNGADSNAAAQAAGGAAEEEAGEAGEGPEAAQHDLRKRLMWTLESMAAAPLELRKRQRHAAEISVRG